MLGVSVALGCGSGSTQQATSASTGPGGGSTTSTSSGTGGTSTTSGTGGGAAAGRNAVATVNAGTVMKNAQYRMVYTLGQSSPSQGKATATGSKAQGGLIGATETKP